jgi:putative glutamine amidotransferase
MKPVVGITSDYDPGNPKTSGRSREPTYFLRTRYAEAIHDLGGIPCILPPTEDSMLQAQLLGRMDGLLITGSGPDLDPRLYGEKKKARLNVMNRRRARFELAVARQAIRMDRPVLGICGGLQLINVAMGGTLIQDIPTQIHGALSHQQKTVSTKTWHRVKIRRGTRLYRILGREAVRVNSSHHQAPLRVAKDLIVNALAPDGIIEGLEGSRHRFIIGVQWHPESFYQRDEVSRKLFRAFIKEAAR